MEKQLIQIGPGGRQANYNTFGHGLVPPEILRPALIDLIPQRCQSIGPEDSADRTCPVMAKFIDGLIAKSTPRNARTAIGGFVAGGCLNLSKCETQAEQLS